MYRIIFLYTGIFSADMRTFKVGLNGACLIRPSAKRFNNWQKLSQVLRWNNKPTFTSLCAIHIHSPVSEWDCNGVRCEQIHTLCGLTSGTSFIQLFCGCWCSLIAHRTRTNLWPYGSGAIWAHVWKLTYGKCVKLHKYSQHPIAASPVTTITKLLPYSYTQRKKNNRLSSSIQCKFYGRCVRKVNIFSILKFTLFLSKSTFFHTKIRKLLSFIVNLLIFCDFKLNVQLFNEENELNG